MAIQQNFDTTLPAKKSPPGEIYSFDNLPVETRDKLLRLQNTDGDFLKTSRKSVVLAQIIFLLLLLNIFGDFVAAFDFTRLDAAKVFVFSIVFITFALWAAYFGRGIYQIFRSPIKHYSYLTPTPLIEIKNCTVKYRELKDVVEIALDKTADRACSGGGNDYILNLKFSDGDRFEYPFERWWTEQIAAAERWRQKATLWRDEAVNAGTARRCRIFRFARYYQNRH